MFVKKKSVFILNFIINGLDYMKSKKKYRKIHYNKIL